MTLREAIIQAWTELGVSRGKAELRLKISDGFIPEAVAHSHCPVKPGLEREFIEEMKQLFRKMDANREGVQAAVRSEMAKRGKRN